MYQPNYTAPEDMTSRLDRSRIPIYGYGGDCRPQCTRTYGHRGPCYPKGPAPIVIVTSGATSYSLAHPSERDPLRKDLLRAAKAKLTRPRHRVIRPVADPLATSPRPVGWHYAGWMK